MIAGVRWSVLAFLAILVVWLSPTRVTRVSGLALLLLIFAVGLG
jgi:hypothetical protein